MIGGTKLAPPPLAIVQVQPFEISTEMRRIAATPFINVQLY
jgi:hypothetical protein